MASLQKKCILAPKAEILYVLYNIGITFGGWLLHILALFNPKIKKFVSGRKNVFDKLRSEVSPGISYIWVHSASLGEFEQGLPVIELIRSEYPDHGILLTFFSPSGYEVRKESPVADIVTYLPLDRPGNVREFLGIVQPVMAIFIKYEVWPNYLRYLEQRNTPTLLISAIFNKRQIYFKNYGAFMRKALNRFTYIFVQNETSKELLRQININQVSISGDTRFDRVAAIREKHVELGFMADFKVGGLCMVAGSTWPEDEDVITDYINAYDGPMVFVIAPHDIKTEHIEQLRKKISKKSLLYSEIASTQISGNEVLIIDTIGLLTRIYAYADIAYVGGGFATGLHNTLEPAVFGVPVIIGPQYHKFQEAVDLVYQKGILVVHNKEEFGSLMDQLLVDDDFRKNTGLINSNYISKKRGASIQIMEHLRTLL